jgi:hypothetical protein
MLSRVLVSFVFASLVAGCGSPQFKGSDTEPPAQKKKPTVSENLKELGNKPEPKKEIPPPKGQLLAAEWPTSLPMIVLRKPEIAPAANGYAFMPVLVKNLVGAEKISSFGFTSLNKDLRTVKCGSIERVENPLTPGQSVELFGCLLSYSDAKHASAALHRWYSGNLIVGKLESDPANARALQDFRMSYKLCVSENNAPNPCKEDPANPRKVLTIEISESAAKDSQVTLSPLIEQGLGAEIAEFWKKGNDAALQMKSLLK